MEEQTITVQYLTFEQFESQLKKKSKTSFKFNWRYVKPQIYNNVIEGYEIEGDTDLDHYMTKSDVLLLLPNGNIAVVMVNQLNLK